MLQHPLVAELYSAHRRHNNLIRAFPPHSVTSCNPEEREASAGGMRQDDVEAIWNSVVGCYRSGLQPAVALCIRRRGEVILDRAIGHLRGNAPLDEPGSEVPIQYDSLFNLFSASKAITAMVIHLLDERGLVRLDDRIAEFIPGFSQNGKEAITLRHILTHRAGIPFIPAEHLNFENLENPQLLIDILCREPIQSMPGTRLSYHALSGGFILGEVVRQVTGRDIRTFLHDEILAPLGFSTFNYGVPPDRLNEVVQNAATATTPWLLTLPLKRAIGFSMREACELSNDPRFLTSVIPSGNIIGTANETSRFYELMLREGTLDGVEIFQSRTIRRARKKQTNGELDYTLLMPVPYGLGFMLGARCISFYGPDTQQAFGHLGLINIVSYCDPERDISVGLLTSGKPFINAPVLWWYNILCTIGARCPKI